MLSPSTHTHSIGVDLGEKDFSVSLLFSSTCVCHHPNICYQMCLRDLHISAPALSSAQGLQLLTQLIIPGHGVGCPSSWSLLCKVVPEADNRWTLL